MNDELEIVWNKQVVAEVKILHYSRIPLEVLSKATGQRLKTGTSRTQSWSVKHSTATLSKASAEMLKFSTEFITESSC